MPLQPPERLSRHGGLIGPLPLAFLPCTSRDANSIVMKLAKCPALPDGTESVTGQITTRQL